MSLPQGSIVLLLPTPVVEQDLVVVAAQIHPQNGVSALCIFYRV